MTLDLVRAVLVATVVIAAPGYFWARLLFPSPDRVETAAVTGALSLTFVPVTALMLAFLFGTGVSLPVALASVAIVTGAGGLTCWRLGSAPYPICREWLAPAPLGSLPLITVSLGAVLMLAMQLHIVRGPTVMGITALLMVLAAVLCYVVRERRDSPLVAPEEEGASSPGDSRQSGAEVEKRASAAPAASRLLEMLTSRGALLAGVLLLVLARGYVGPVLRDWPYIRGQDIYAHTVMVNLVLSTGAAGTYMVYPPGFHATVAVISRLSGLPPLRLYPVLAPALLLLPATACYVLGRRLFGPVVALAAAFFAGVVLNSPWLFLRDGTYVDLIAAEFLLVLAVVALVGLLVAPSARGVVLLALLGASVVFYHSVATIYLALLLALVSALFLPYLFLRDRRRGVMLFSSLAMLSVLAAFGAWDTYDLPRTVGSLLGITKPTATANHATMAIGTQLPNPVDTLPRLLSEPVVFLGLLGLLLLAPALRTSRPPRAMSISLLLLWVIGFFAASQTTLSAFPIRFARDLGVPLALLAALAFVTLLRSFQSRKAPSVVAIALVSLVVILQAQQGLLVAIRPSSQLFMTRGFDAAGAWLKAHNEGGSLVVSPHLNQVTANAMLAMGGYSGLPAYTAGQLKNPRVVPVRDRRKVRDVLWTIQHPASGRTASILESYDVRYVVLYKRFRKGTLWRGKNPVQWRSFLRYPERYNVAFQNDDVIILGVKR